MPQRPRPKVCIDKLLSLVEQWTRCEVMGRLGAWDNDFICWVDRRIEIENEIRILLYGSSNLVELGERWSLLNRFKGCEEK